MRYALTSVLWLTSCQSGIPVDSTPPSVFIESPSDGTSVDSNTPELRVSYRDVGRGVDSAAFRVKIGRVDLSVEFEQRGGYAAATVPPSKALRAGLHRMSVYIEDRGGNSASATSLFHVTTGEQTADPRIDEALELLLAGDSKEAKILATAVFDGAVADATLSLALCDSFSVIGEHEAAVDLLQQAVSIHSDDVPLLSALAAEQFDLERYSDAAQTYRAVVDVDPSDNASRLWAATSFALASDPIDAVLEIGELPATAFPLQQAMVIATLSDAAHDGGDAAPRTMRELHDSATTAHSRYCIALLGGLETGVSAVTPSNAVESCQLETSLGMSADTLTVDERSRHFERAIATNESGLVAYYLARARLRMVRR